MRHLPDDKRKHTEPPPVLKVELDDVLDVTLDPEPPPTQDTRPWLISDEQLQLIGLPPRRPTDPDVISIDEDPATLQRRRLAAQTESAEIKAEMDYLKLKRMREECARPTQSVRPDPTMYQETKKHIDGVRAKRKARRKHQ